MKKLGFGCMRLPLAGERIDIDEVTRMVDLFMKSGFTYFDTAHGYVKGMSEGALRECLTSRYPRESYLLADKLSTHHFRTTAEIRPLFESQLKACGVEYFDYYLMHAQDRNIYAKFKRLNAYETALEFLNEGRIRHFGISFHDKAEVLEMILQENPRIEVVQIQLNYADYEDPSVESRKCLEVCHKYHKPVIVMEPVKGGSLVKLPKDAQRVFDELGGGSAASYAIRFAAGQEGVMMVLSGMRSVEMLADNISYMNDFQPLNQKEQEAVNTVCEILKRSGSIPCTDCRYCMEVCPQGIAIPDLFACLNAKRIFNNWNTAYYYRNIHTQNGGKPSQCIGCGRCETLCPQHLEIRRLLGEVAEAFEKD